MPTDRAVWQPRASDLEASCVAELMRRAQVETYEALHAFSLAEPEAYWRLLNDWLGVQWRADWHTLTDTSRGKELPSWFVGGALNYTDTIFARTHDPVWRDALAVVAHEEGGRTTLTWGELAALAHSLAAGLRGRGVRRGDRVGLLMANGAEATATVLALGLLGAVVAPLFSGFGVEPIVSRLEACGASVLVASSGFVRRGRYVDVAPTLAAARARLPALKTVVVHASPHAGPLPADVVPWGEVAAEAGERVEAETMAPMDPMMTIFTSGTTGRPKGVVHVHGGFPLRIAHDAALYFDVREGDVFFWPADMGWIAGSLVMMSALMRGATLVLYDGAPDVPDIGRMGRLVEANRVTHYGASPTLVRALRANAEVACAADLGSLRLKITAGETIAPDDFVWFQHAFGPADAPLVNYTGGTEVSGGLLSSVVVKPIQPAGFNAAVGGIDVDVVDPDGRPVVGEPGELAIREPFVGMTAGFWNDETRYVETYWSAIPGLWVHGDLAQKDAAGNFVLLGRSDDTLKVAGKRVGPAEVEAILVAIEGVEEAAVIGVPDAAKGEAIVAFLTAPSAAADAPRSSERSAVLREEATGRVRDRLGRPFAPREVYVVDALPKTRSLKVMRRLIRSVYTGAPQGDVSSLVNPEAIDAIASVIAPSLSAQARRI